jgi:hypothetical protein
LSSCTFSPPSVTPGGSTATFTMAIATTAPTAALRQWPFRRPPVPLYGWGMVVPGLVLAGAMSGRRKRIGTAILLAIIAASLLLPCAGCGSGSHSVQQQPVTQPGTPSGTYTVTVTGSSNSTQHSMTVTLTVQ